MSLFSQLLAFSFVGVFFAWILFLIFGQVTVRKLRKNPKVKGKLGFEFVSGYDTFNVASALTAPKWFRDKFSKSPLSFLAADYQALYQYTTLFDRILARIFWILFITSASLMILIVVLNQFGLFSDPY